MDHFLSFQRLRQDPSPSFFTKVHTEVETFFKKDFIYLFLERGVGREQERERNIIGCLPDWELNPRLFSF